MVSLTKQGEKDGSGPVLQRVQGWKGERVEGQVSDDHLVPGQDQVTHDQGDNDHRCVNAKV